MWLFYLGSSLIAPNEGETGRKTLKNTKVYKVILDKPIFHVD